MTRPRKKKSKMQAYGPAVGLLLAVAGGVLAYAVSKPVDDILKQHLTGFRQMPPDRLQIFTTVVIFIVFVLLVSLIVAAAAPRKKTIVSEKQMVKDREAMINEKKMTKLRREKMNRMNKGG
jgi:predicted PurR-regulated permease PerM